MPRPLVPITYDDYRELARRRLIHRLFEYIDGGSYGEVTLAENPAALDRLALRQRVLRDVSERRIETTVLGQTWAQPVGLAPVGLAGFFRRRGEVQAVRAAEAAGVPFTLSTVGLCSIEEVAQAATHPFWFQLYVMRDRGFVAEVIARAQAAGCSALVLTVDLPMPGARYRDIRSGMVGGVPLAGRLAMGLDLLRHWRWVWDVGIRGRPHVFGTIAPKLPSARSLPDFVQWVGENFDASVTWKDVEWIRSLWKGPLVLKGLLDPADAVDAASAGVEGIVVSNHGGRQLDGVPATITALPRIAEAVGDRVEVLFDGGVRSGLDVFRALALGARAALLGRAWVYPMAAAGQEGITRVLERFAMELQVGMALSGVTTIDAIGPDALVLPEEASG